MARVLRMPGVSANATEAVLSEWLVEESGDFAAADALATVETEKAAVDVEADVAGRPAVEEQGDVDAEVIDLRWLDRASIDWESIEQSLTKTNRILIAEQGAVGTSYGGWLADEIHRRFFDLLDAPVWRVTGGEASPSISKVLERAAIAQKDEVVAVLDEIARY